MSLGRRERGVGRYTLCWKWPAEHSSDSSLRLFPHLYNGDKENIELIGVTRGFSEYMQISVKCMIAPHVRGSCCFRQKHSCRDKSNVSAPQSLEDRSFITPNSLALALYLLHSPALLCSARRFCKQTWHFTVFRRRKQVGSGVPGSALLASHPSNPSPQKSSIAWGRLRGWWAVKHLFCFWDD